MSNRRRAGFALLAALWLVVAIATVALAFATEARARRVLALGASDRAAERAAALGGLAIARGRLERVIRDQQVTGGGAGALRSADPWLDADTLFADPIDVGGTPVRVHVADLGASLFVNALQEDELRNFIAYVTNDYSTADQIAQGIADWIDLDDLARGRGGERDEYLAAGRLVLPPNHPVRDVAELRDVEGMTPAILAELRPYLTTLGTGRINVNSAPVPVLRAITGMTDDVIARIMSARSAHRRIRSLADIMAAPSQGRPGTAPAVQTEIARRVVFDVSELEVTVDVVRPSDPRPATLRAVVQRNGTQSAVSWMGW
jgi:general secretion pathway protein K